jgi:hypothetical protein
VSVSSTPLPSPPRDSELEALQSALAAEHAAVFAYGVIGGRLGPDNPGAVEGFEAHRDLRDRLSARIGSSAVAAEAAYSLPFPVTNDRQAARLAREIEQRCAAVYAYAVGHTTGPERMLAARALTDCALRSLAWGARPEPFPGLGDL